MGGDNLAKALATYDWAVTHNPTNPTRFITDSSGAIVRNSSAAYSPLSIGYSVETVNYTGLIIIASTVALVAVGGYFLLRKARKED